MSTAFADAQAFQPPPLAAPEANQQEKLEQLALTIPQQARAIVVRDQATMDAAGAMLTDVIKPLRAEAATVFDPIIKAAHESHKLALAGKARVEKPLIDAENILKLSIGTFAAEQERIRQAEQARLQREYEEEQRRLAAEAEEKRKADEAALNAQIQAEHEAEIERQLESLPADADPSQVAELCYAQAPEPVRIAPEIPVFAPAPVARPTVAAPQGVSMQQRWKAEVTSIQLLCRAIADGRLPAHYVEPNMTALNAMARANKQSMNVPGVRAVAENTVSARGR